MADDKEDQPSDDVPQNEDVDNDAEDVKSNQDEQVLEISGSLDSDEEHDQVADLVEPSDYGTSTTKKSKQSFTVRRLKHKIKMERDVDVLGRYRNISNRLKKLVQLIVSRSSWKFIDHNHSIR